MPHISDLGLLILKNLAKMVALVFLVLLALVVLAQVSNYFAAYLFPRVYPRPYIEMISAFVAGSVAAGALIAYPLHRLFPKRFWLAAIVVSMPMMGLRGRQFLAYLGTAEERIIVMSAVEFLIYPAAILACECLASPYLRPKPD